MARADQRDINRQLSSSHGSFELVVSPVVLGLLGWWIDSRAGTGPWITVALAAFGVAGAVTKLYYEYRARMAAADAETQAARDERAAELAAVRSAEAAERAAVEAELAERLAAAQAADPTTTSARRVREVVS